jgi:hypothetical protein
MILSALATNVGVAALIVTSRQGAASPTNPRSPIIDWKNIAAASPYCGAKFEN